MFPRSSVVLLSSYLSLSACACARRDVSTSTDTRSARVTSGGVDWSPRVEIARGEAVRGPWQQNDSVYRWVDDPSVQIAGDGDAVVAWVDQSKKDVFVGRWSREGVARMREPVNVSRNGATFSWLPRLFADANRVHVLWQEIIFSGGSHGGDILFATSNDGGRTFAPPINLSDSIAGDGKGRIDEKTWDNGSLDLARGPGGEIYATWTEYEGALWLRRSDDGGATFGPAVRIGGTREAPARGPSIGVGKGGEVHVAWALGEDPRAAVRVSMSVDRGATFGTPRAIGGESGRADTPSIAIDDTGAMHLVFVQDGRVNYVRGSEPARNNMFGPGAVLPRVAVDGARGVFVLWEKGGAGSARPRGLVLARSTDGGDTFSDADVPAISRASLGMNGSQQGMLLEKMTVASSGREVALVNSTFLEGRESHVWLLRGTIVARP